MEFRSHGGRRAGAGRKPASARPPVHHVKRPCAGPGHEVGRSAARAGSEPGLRPQIPSRICYPGRSEQAVFSARFGPCGRAASCSSMFRTSSGSSRAAGSRTSSEHPFQEARWFSSATTRSISTRPPSLPSKITACFARRPSSKLRCHVYAMTSLPELEYQLRSAGFRELETYGSYAARSPELIRGDRILISGVRPARARSA